jgi:hypothetical protein
VLCSGSRNSARTHAGKVRRAVKNADAEGPPRGTLSQEKDQSIKALPSGPGAAAFKSGVKESDTSFQRISSRPWLA